MDETLMDIGAHVAGALADTGLTWSLDHDELNIVTEAAHIVQVLRFLRDDATCRFCCLIDISGVDYPERERRFDVAYHLLSPYQNCRVRVKLATDEESPVPSAVDVFPAANWYEREVFDLYGVRFTGHPDLRRILTDYGFSGHPLRKDFPTPGYVEVRYDDEKKRVVYEPVKLVQESRSFDYLSPWQGPDYPLPGDEKAGGTN